VGAKQPQFSAAEFAMTVAAWRRASEHEGHQTTRN